MRRILELFVRSQMWRGRMLGAWPGGAAILGVVTLKVWWPVGVSDTCFTLAPLILIATPCIAQGYPSLNVIARSLAASQPLPARSSPLLTSHGSLPASPGHPLTAPALLSPIRNLRHNALPSSPAATAAASPSPLRAVTRGPTVPSARTTLAAILEPDSPTEAQLATYGEFQLEAREELRRLANDVHDRMGSQPESVVVRDARLRYVRYAKAVVAAKLKAGLWEAHHQAALDECERADAYWQASVDEQAALLTMMSPAESLSTTNTNRRAEEAFHRDAFISLGESPELGPRATEYIAFHTELWGWLDPSELACIFWILGSDYEEFEDQLVELGIEKNHAQYLTTQMVYDKNSAAVPTPAHVPTY